MNLKEKLESLPTSPGVYIYRNAAGDAIYIGKAKSLRSRVRSYFRPSAQHAPRIARMVSEISDLEVIVVGSEMEALILECNLIKRELPRYNVVLRDDKHFPYLRLSVGDEYPRVSLVRRARLDGGLYAGPFLPSASAWNTLKLIQRLFGVATCKERFDGRRRPCLYYHMDQCLAPCAGKTTPEEYALAVADARLLLEGRHGELEDSLKQKMSRASGERRYEAAARLRDAYATVRALRVRQRLSSAGLEEQDYLAHHAEDDKAALQLFQMRAGKIQARRGYTMEETDFEPASFYRTALIQCYADGEPPPEIFLPHLPEESALLESWLSQRRGGRVRLRVPLRGPKRKFMELVRRNAELAFEGRFKAAHTGGVAGAEELASVLALERPPLRIECFDISNIQGTDAVASMVAWEGGKFRRKEYRGFNIRSVEGADDCASIAEAVSRRYSRLIAEDRRLPDLVLLDGGAGQLGAAVGALARVGLAMLPVISIAKREEELYVEGRAGPLRLQRSSAALQLVQRIRDEAHRFAVAHHRRKRARRTLRTELTEVPGIGPATARKLLREFGSLAAVRRASEEELRGVVGKKVARALISRFGA
jgi:excinuclease ABC subunit C